MAPILLLPWFSLSRAEEPGPAPTPADAAVDAPTEAAPEIPEVLGPAKVEVGKGVVVDLPEGYGLFEKAEAKGLSEQMGNFHNDDLLAIIERRQQDSDWLLFVEYIDEGYVSDKDAGDLDADELLKSYKDGTEEANKERKEKGFGEIHVEDWVAKPTYDTASHQLSWGLSASGEHGKSVNYFVRALGRKGYASLDLIASAATIEAARADAAPVISGTAFKEGLRYADFNEKTDKVAEYGLAALVLGGAGAVAAKTGLLAKLLALLIAGKKVIFVGLAGAATAVKKFFGVKTEPPKDEAPKP